MTARLDIWPDRDQARAVEVWPNAGRIAPGTIQEAREHLFVLTGDPAAGAADLLIDETPLEALRARAPDQAVWRWTPGFHAGAVEGRLRMAGRSPAFEIVTDPAERKLTRDAFDTMVGEVLEDSFALFALSAFRKGVERGPGNRPPPIARLEYLRSRLPELVKIVTAIDRQPRRLLRSEERVVPLHRAVRATAPEILRSFRSGRLRREVGPSRLPAILKGALPEVVRLKLRVSSQDLAETRQIKASLELWATWLEGVGALLGRIAEGSPDDLSATRLWTVRTRRMARQLRTLLKLSVFDGVGSAAPRPGATPIWRSDPRYRRFARLHREMSLGLASVFGDFLQMPLARTFDLYELWAYLRLTRAAADRFGAGPEDVAGLFDAGPGVTLTSGQAIVRFPKAGLALAFQRRYREFWLEADGRGSFSREMRPDIVIENLPGADERLIILDAKYRIGADLNDALASTHMYRDALVEPSETEGVRRIVGGAYLLSPHAPGTTVDWRKTSMPGRLFHPAYRSSFRFGAMTLTPGMSHQAIGAALDLILADAVGSET